MQHARSACSHCDIRIVVFQTPDGAQAESEDGMSFIPDSLVQRTRSPHDRMRRLLAQRKEGMQPTRPSRPKVVAALLRKRELLTYEVSKFCREKQWITRRLHEARAHRKVARETYLKSPSCQKRRLSIIYECCIRNVRVAKRDLEITEDEIARALQALAEVEHNLKG